MELVVFGLVALLVGTGLLWLVGWVLSIGGVALKWVAGLLWNLLRFIVPVAIAGGLVYFLVKAAQDRKPTTTEAGGGSAATATGGTGMASTVRAAPSTTHGSVVSPQGASGPAPANRSAAPAVSEGQETAGPAADAEQSNAANDTAAPSENDGEDERA